MKNTSLLAPCTQQDQTSRTYEHLNRHSRSVVFAKGLIVLNPHPSSFTELGWSTKPYSSSFAKTCLCGLDLAPRTSGDIDSGLFGLGGSVCWCKTSDLVALLVCQNTIYVNEKSVNKPSKWAGKVGWIPCLWAYSASESSNLSTWVTSVNCPVKLEVGFVSMT